MNEQWSSVIFAKESSFYGSNRQWVYSRSREWFAQCCISDGVGDILMGSKTKLIFIETSSGFGGLSANRYIEETVGLMSFIPHSLGFIGGNLVTTQNNARPQIAAPFWWSVQEVEIECMELRDRSSALNPIEHWARNPASAKGSKL